MARDDQYWGSARSDYGRYAYGGDLNERGVERRHEWRGGRGFFRRAGDEVRSWFGDDEAEHRRHLDELRRRYGRVGYYDEPEFETRKPGGRGSEVSHVGKGPRGWRRSDERILEDVCDLMMLDPDLDASDIEVLVSNGEVILEGSVESRWAKRLAEDIAFSVSGVRDVQNRLRVSYVVKMNSSLRG
jgi:osmotically-inducible protein OsmY